MPNFKLGGLRRIDELIDDDTIQHQPGVYLLYRTYDGPVRYVGRSDNSLINRIYGREYVYYQYKHCSSPTQAYYWECRYWHEYQDTIENSAYNRGKHPSRPEGSNRRCRYCGH